MKPYADVISIGRAQNNVFSVPRDSKIGRWHARIEVFSTSLELSISAHSCSDNIPFVVDLGSRNGLKVDGVDCRFAPLFPRCKIEIGESAFFFSGIFAFQVSSLRVSDEGNPVLRWSGSIRLRALRSSGLCFLVSLTNSGTDLLGKSSEELIEIIVEYRKIAAQGEVVKRMLLIILICRIRAPAARKRRKTWPRSCSIISVVFISHYQEERTK